MTARGSLEKKRNRETLSIDLFQEEIETQRQQHDARVMSIRTEEKQKMDKMADDLDQKWRDALRSDRPPLPVRPLK